MSTPAQPEAFEQLASKLREAVAVSFNVRYAQYARIARGTEPEKALALDRKEWPGGVMVGFTLWLRARWTEFAAVRPAMHPEFKREEDHAAFDQWLKSLPGK